MENHPAVSICIPCYNEENTIRKLLEALYRQTYPRNKLEVIIADGMSEDSTRQKIQAFQAENPDLAIKVIDNPKRIIPAALNSAIHAAKGVYIVRLDAHSVPHPEYVARSISGLEHHLGNNVGGIWKIVPSKDTWIANAIAAAASHPLGVGDAKYRYADTPGESETVPFGAFRKEYILSLGGYDESLLTNEDYELNTRILQSGGKIWLDPNIQVQYYSRPNLRALARQYLRYGYWKVKMLQRYPESIRWRQALPPLFVLGLLAMAIAAIWIPAVRWLLLGVMVLYIGALIISGLDVVLDSSKYSMLLGVPVAIVVMHISWGSAFIWSLIEIIFQKRKPLKESNERRE
jgi:glycosyltransferase involved in cell wall biosynthesis